MPDPEQSLSSAPLDTVPTVTTRLRSRARSWRSRRRKWSMTRRLPIAISYAPGCPVRRTRANRTLLVNGSGLTVPSAAGAGRWCWAGAGAMPSWATLGLLAGCSCRPGGWWYGWSCCRPGGCGGRLVPGLGACPPGPGLYALEAAERSTVRSRPQSRRCGPLGWAVYDVVGSAAAWSRLADYPHVRAACGRRPDRFEGPAGGSTNVPGRRRPARLAGGRSRGVTAALVVRLCGGCRPTA